MLHYQTGFVMCSTIIAILISVLLGNKRNEKLKMLKLKSSWFWRIFLLTKLSIHCCWDSGTLDNRLSLNTRAKVTIEKQECLRDCESTPRSQMPNKPLKCDVLLFFKKSIVSRNPHPAELRRKVGARASKASGDRSSFVSLQSAVVKRL